MSNSPPLVDPRLVAESWLRTQALASMGELAR